MCHRRGMTGILNSKIRLLFRLLLLTSCGGVQVGGEKPDAGCGVYRLWCSEDAGTLYTCRGDGVVTHSSRCFEPCVPNTSAMCE